MNRLASLLTDGDTVAFVGAHVSIIAIPLFELLVALPMAAEVGSGTWAVLFLVGLYSFVNVYGNYLLLCLTDASTKKMILPALLQPGWRYCHACEATAPPRSHHCHTCKTCVRLKDHHCSFSRRCVGLGNIRYFLCLLAHLVIGGFYSTLLNIRVIASISGGSINISSLLMLMFPLYALTGDAPAASFITLMVCSVTFLGAMISLVYGWYTLSHLTKGLTTKEFHSLSAADAGLYDRGLNANMRLMFGIRWRLVMLFPTLSSKLITDGTSYPTEGSIPSLKQL